MYFVYQITYLDTLVRCTPWWCPEGVKSTPLGSGSRRQSHNKYTFSVPPPHRTRNTARHQLKFEYYNIMSSVTQRYNVVEGRENFLKQKTYWSVLGGQFSLIYSIQKDARPSLMLYEVMRLQDNSIALNCYSLEEKLKIN